MQGNDNFVRTFKKNEKDYVGPKDRKRDKTREKDQRKILRKLKLKEMSDD